MQLAKSDIPLKMIDVKFMVSGHSYLPNDSDFGVIEKSCQELENIYSPQQYLDIIRTCTFNTTFMLHEMTYLNFISTKELETCVTNRKIDEKKIKFSWNKISQIRLLKSEPLKMLIKEKLAEKKFSIVDL